jgi:hypothetical protein
MAPERTGFLAVLDLNFEGQSLLSQTQVITGKVAKPSESGDEKFYVDWTSIKRPEGYTEVAGGVAYIRDDPPAVWHQKKTEHVPATTGAGRYTWRNWANPDNPESPTKSEKPEDVEGEGLRVLILVLPEGHRLCKLEPKPMAMHAKAFDNRLAVVIWAFAREECVDVTLELKELKRDLQSEVKIVNNWDFRRSARGGANVPVEFVVKAPIQKKGRSHTHRPT